MTNNACAKCGGCTVVCPVYRITGRESLTARGRLHLLEKMGGDRHSKAYQDIIAKCLLCGACQAACPRGLKTTEMIAAERDKSGRSPGGSSFAASLVKLCLAHNPLLASIAKILKIHAGLLAKLPTDSGLRLKLGIPFHGGVDIVRQKIGPGARETAKLPGPTIFAGCFARYLYADITAKATSLMTNRNDSSPDFVEDQSCCGLAFYSSGEVEKARHLARLNISAFAKNDRPVIVLCGSCFSHLKSYPDLLADDGEWQPKAVSFANRLRELSSFLIEAGIAERPLPTACNNVRKRVLYHDPCHLRYNESLTEAPRQLLRNQPGLELIELPGGPQCCGFGGLFSLANPELSNEIAGELVKNIIAVSPDIVVTSCSGCLIQLRKHLAIADSRIRVHHLTRVLGAIEEG